jgi:hypothetical protein
LVLLLLFGFHYWFFFIYHDPFLFVMKIISSINNYIYLYIMVIYITSTMLSLLSLAFSAKSISITIITITSFTSGDSVIWSVLSLGWLFFFFLIILSFFPFPLLYFIFSNYSLLFDYHFYYYSFHFYSFIPYYGFDSYPVELLLSFLNNILNISMIDRYIIFLHYIGFDSC